MTSKSLEALENIVVTFDEMGFVPTTSNPNSDFSFSYWFGGEYNIIKQDLECLELIEALYNNTLEEMKTIKDDDRKLYLKFKELEKENQELKQVWNKEEWCQGIPLSAESLKSLFNYNEELFKKNLELDKENLILKQSVKDTFDTSQEIIADLKKELEQEKWNGIEYWEEFKKFKKAIEILKDNLISVRQGVYNDETFYLNCEFKTIEITKQEYDLLKEVLREYE